MGMPLNSSSLRILFGITGSVASVKVPLLIETLYSKASVKNISMELKLIATENALHFFNPKDPAIISRNLPLYLDQDEFNTWKSLGDEVLHIELRNWADVLLVAPLSANTLGKLANGLCDNLITCVLRAWDFKKPCIVAPAMNTAMYLHPLTKPQLDLIQTWGIHVLPPIRKKLACGDTGIGAMAEPKDIVEYTLDTLLNSFSNRSTTSKLDFKMTTTLGNEEKNET